MDRKHRKCKLFTITVHHTSHDIEKCCKYRANRMPETIEKLSGFQTLQNRSCNKISAQVHCEINGYITAQY